jgi:mono/diheme cytochrome c family protein
MTGRTAGALVVLASALVVASCGSARRSEPLVGAWRPSNAETAQGERVFMAHCHACHPGGETGLGPSLNDKPLPAFLVRLQIRNGLGAMPAFAPDELPDGDLQALVAYLRARRSSGRGG